MPTCKKCGKEFPSHIVINGVVKKLFGRLHCLECYPLLKKSEHSCKKCGNIIPLFIIIDDIKKDLHKRSHCLECKPFLSISSRIPYDQINWRMFQELHNGGMSMKKNVENYELP